MVRAGYGGLIFSFLAALGPAGAAPATHDVPIGDPVLGMTAWTVSVPEGWTASGTMLPGSSCDGATSPVVRAQSADGGSGFYLLPRTDWAWGGAARSASSDCLPWDHEVSAKTFLDYEMKIQRVAFVRYEPVEGATGQLPPGFSRDVANARVAYSIAGKRVDEVIQAAIVCHAAPLPMGGEMHMCSSQVTRAFAPGGKLDAMRPVLESIKLHLDQQWWSAWQAASIRHYQQLSQAQTARLLEQGNLAEAQRMRAHQAYMANAEAGYAAHNAAFAAGQYDKQRQSDNFVDYVLDCQRAYSPSGNVRVSSESCPNRQTF